MMIHSVPAQVQSAPCATTAAPPHARLRHCVLGYGGFRSGSGRPVRHRLFPLGLVTLVIDPDVGPLVTGARTRATADGPTTWGTGVTIALTPAGVPGLLGVAMRELTDRTLPLADVLAGHAARELTERLAAAPDWTGRFAVLDALLRPDRRHQPDPAATAVWRRLHRGQRIDHITADLGIKRRHLERMFRTQVGLPPGAIRRIARFQRAVDQIGRGVALAEAAARSGYADQSHLTRETRNLASVTPGELRALVQLAA